jgi:hypothetical protein
VGPQAPQQAPPQAATATAHKHTLALAAVAAAQETQAGQRTEQTAATAVDTAQAVAVAGQQPTARPLATAVTEHLGLSSSRLIFDL